MENSISRQEIDWMQTVGGMKRAQCDTCLRDAGYRADEDAGCEILFGTIFTGEIPGEWNVDGGVCDEFEPA